MLARMLLTDEHHPIIFWIRKIVAGAIIGIIAYFALYGTNISGLYKSIILSTAGAGSPELMDVIRNRYSKLSNEKQNKIKKSKKRK